MTDFTHADVAEYTEVSGGFFAFICLSLSGSRMINQSIINQSFICIRPMVHIKEEKRNRY